MIGTAPIYLLAEGAHAETAAWASFSAAKDTPEFCQSWLAIAGLQIGRVGGALLLLGPDAQGAYVPAAVWPHVGRDLQYPSSTAERTLSERRGIVGSAKFLYAPQAPRRRDADAAGGPIFAHGAALGSQPLGECRPRLMRAPATP
jgi:hypothetical protein